MPILNGTKLNKGKSVGVVVTVTSTVGFSKIDEKLIVGTVVGDIELHQSTKVKGAPLGMIGYIHNLAENTVLAVTALDKTAMTITIPKGGQVKAGVHVFK